MTAATSDVVNGGGVFPIGTVTTTEPWRSSFTLRAGDTGVCCGRSCRCSDSAIPRSYLTGARTPRARAGPRSRVGSATELSQSPAEHGDIGALGFLGEVERLLELDGGGVLESAARHRFADVGE